MRKPPAVNTLDVLALTPLEEDYQTLQEIFRHSNWRLSTADNWTDAYRILNERTVTLILCNEHFLEGHWTKFLEKIEGIPNEPGLIIVSDNADDRLWAEALNRGALDVLPKPFRTLEVLRTVSAAARHALWKSVRSVVPATAG
jgi:DNA-binding NtrC family response regulator